MRTSRRTAAWVGAACLGVAACDGVLCDPDPCDPIPTLARPHVIDDNRDADEEIVKDVFTIDESSPAGIQLHSELAVLRVDLPPFPEGVSLQLPTVGTEVTIDLDSGDSPEAFIVLRAMDGTLLLDAGAPSSQPRPGRAFFHSRVAGDGAPCCTDDRGSHWTSTFVEFLTDGDYRGPAWLGGGETRDLTIEGRPYLGVVTFAKEQYCQADLTDCGGILANAYVLPKVE